MSSLEAASLFPLPSRAHPRQVANASCTASHSTSLLESTSGGLVPFPKKALRSAPLPKNKRRLATVSHTLRRVKFPHSQLPMSVCYISDLTTFRSQRNPASQQKRSKQCKTRSSTGGSAHRGSSRPLLLTPKSVPTRPAAQLYCTSQGRLP